MNMQFSRRTKGRRQLERFFLLTGIGCVGIWVFSIAGPAVYQDWGSWSFDQKLRGSAPTLRAYLEAKKDIVFSNGAAATLAPSPFTEAAPLTLRKSFSAPSVLKSGSLVGRLNIPRLHLNSMVREGAGETTLSVALGHIPGTALPGQSGNVGVAGHRDKLFRGLKDIHSKDVVQFETLGGTYSYQVESVDIVTPRDVGVLKAGSYPELTLVTCYPFYYVGPAPKRFIVKARLITDGLKTGAPVVVSKVDPPAVLTPESITRRAAKPKPSDGRTVFSVSANHSQQVAPGVLLGLTNTDAVEHRLSGWLWLAAEHRTLWLHDKSPVTIYAASDGRTRELVITTIAKNSIAGYVVTSSMERRVAWERPNEPR